MICFIHGFPYGLTTQKTGRMAASLGSSSIDATALRAGAFIRNNRFIRLVISGTSGHPFCKPSCPEKIIKDGTFGA
jgi:hypothetical protein